MKIGEGLAAAPDGQIHVLLQDQHGALVKDYADVQVKLALKLVSTAADSNDAVELTQAGTVREYAVASVVEGVAVFTGVTVTGKDLPARALSSWAAS